MLSLNKDNAVQRRKITNIVLEVLMIVAALIFIYPAVFVLINAFKLDAEITTNPVGLPSAFTLDNFHRVLTASGDGVTFFKALFNTLFLALVSVLGILLFSSMAAWAMVRNKGKVSGFLFAFFAFFLVIPFQVIMVPLVVLATDMKSLNLMGLVLMYWGLGVPVGVFFYHGFIKGVPASLEESASIDGAGVARTFFTIVFPLLTSITVTVGILDIIWVWNDFLLPYIILKKGTLVLFQFANFTGTFSTDYGGQTASLVLTATPVIILFLSLQRYYIKGIAAGAVKG
ncbi:MAG: carbohydrate ABC transporter permease [Spirochaetales bacterium]|nr:carbohydrate ABC transporter permease [Spirochaetales bacterium]